MNTTKEGADLLHEVFSYLINDAKVIADVLTGNWGKVPADFKAWLDNAKKIGADAKALISGNTTPNNPSATGAAPVSGTQADRATFAINYLKSQGVSDAAARGSIAGAIAESRLNPNAVNPKSGAYGIGQWLGSRKAALFGQYGASPTFDQQLRFLLSELKGGDRGGASVLRATTPQAALDAYVRNLMRPGPGVGGDLLRGGAAFALVGSTSNNNSRSSNVKSDVKIGAINVHVPAGSNGTRIGKEAADAVRTQPFVAAANYGLA